MWGVKEVDLEAMVADSVVVEDSLDFRMMEAELVEESDSKAVCPRKAVVD